MKLCSTKSAALKPGCYAQASSNTENVRNVEAPSSSDNEIRVEFKYEET